VEGERMRLAAWLNHTDAFLGLHNDMKIGTCLCGIAAETGETIVSLDSDKDSRHHIRYPGMTPHGHVVVPLKTGAEVVGVLYLYLPAGQDMAKAELNLLEAIGNQLAAAIVKDRLFRETEKLSLHDPLTGLANRNLMNIELADNVARMRRFGHPFSLLMIDLDHFKLYNDSYGHTAGRGRADRSGRPGPLPGQGRRPQPGRGLALRRRGRLTAAGEALAGAVAAIARQQFQGVSQHRGDHCE